MNPQFRNKIKGKVYEFGHDKDGRMIKVTKFNGKETGREYTGETIVWPGGLGTKDGRAGVADLGIRKFKNSQPKPDHSTVAQFKRNTWAYPVAQMQINMSAMKEAKRGKNKR